MWPKDQELQSIMNSLVVHFGEETMSDAMAVLGERINRGDVIENAFAFCWGVAFNKVRDLLKKRDSDPVMVQLSKLEAMEDAGISMPDAAVDWRNPEDTYAAKEILESMPVELVEDTPMDGCSHDETAQPDVLRQWRARTIKQTRKTLKF